MSFYTVRSMFEFWVSGKIVEKYYLENPNNFYFRCGPVFSPIVSTLNRIYENKSINYINEKIEEFSVNAGFESLDELKYAGNCLNGFKTNRNCPRPTNYMFHHQDNYFNELHSYSKYNVSYHNPEVFYFRHGLRFANQKILEYIKNKDIFDIGAYIGDSCIVLSNYTKKKVFSYECSPNLTHTIQETIENNHLKDKCVLFNEGVTNEPGVTFINDVANPGGSIDIKGDTEISLTTIDKEVEEKGIVPGFIKADVEGAGLNVVKGAAKSIAKYRPVLSIAAYHSFDELFVLPEFMKTFPNYLFEFHSESIWHGTLGEIGFFAYPAEIVYDEFPH